MKIKKQKNVTKFPMFKTVFKIKEKHSCCEKKQIVKMSKQIEVFKDVDK
jgi:hypothetical protein